MTALEAYAVNDYSAIDARYTDGVIEAKITQAERWVNEYCGQTFTGTIPDGVVFAVLEMAKYLMNLQLKEDEYLEELPTTLKNVLQICKDPLEKNKITITYSSSANDFYLKNLEG